MEALSLEAGELSLQLTLRLTSFMNDVEGLTFVHLSICVAPVPQLLQSYIWRLDTSKTLRLQAQDKLRHNSLEQETHTQFATLNSGVYISTWSLTVVDRALVFGRNNT